MRWRASTDTMERLDGSGTSPSDNPPDTEDVDIASVERNEKRNGELHGLSA